MSLKNWEVLCWIVQYEMRKYEIGKMPRSWNWTIDSFLTSFETFQLQRNFLTISVNFSIFNSFDLRLPNSAFKVHASQK